jgi:hypothetical protein
VRDCVTSGMSGGANPSLFKAYAPKVALQRADLAGRDDRPDVAVRAHKHPITGHHTIRVAQVGTGINDVAAGTDDVDVQPRARRHRITFDFIAQ